MYLVIKPNKYSRKKGRPRLIMVKVSFNEELKLMILRSKYKSDRHDFMNRKHYNSSIGQCDIIFCLLLQKRGKVQHNRDNQKKKTPLSFKLKVSKIQHTNSSPKAKKSIGKLRFYSY